MAKFGEGDADIRFTFVADENADFTEANLDCAIRLVDGPGDLQGIELDEARRVTVARPEALGGAPDQWIDWGLPLQDGVAAHVTVSNAGQALSSALAGLGKAILPELLAKESIDAGRLEVLDGPHTGTRAYWLVAPTPQWRTKKVRSLVSFLSE